jgi:hypothetical protein
MFRSFVLCFRYRYSSHRTEFLKRTARCDFNGVKSCTDHHELPVRPRPSISSDIALEFGAVARITWAPPIFCSSCAAFVGIQKGGKLRCSSFLRLG